MANALFLTKTILLVFLLLIMAVMLVFFVQSVIAISRNESKKHYTNVAITSALVVANAVFGFVATIYENFTFILIFAIIQTMLVIIGIISLAVETLFVIPWVGSAFLAFVFSYLIKVRQIAMTWT